MDLARVRGSEWLAGIAGLVLLVAMFGFDWYEIGGAAGPAIDALGAAGIDAATGIKAWESQGFTGTIANLVILAAAVSGIGLAVLAGSSRTVALPVAASALTAQLGAAAVVMIVLRMIFQPGPNEIVDLQAGIWVALAAAAVVMYGGWRSMEEEMGPYSPSAGPASVAAKPPDGSPLAPPPPEEPAPPPPSSSSA